jgi:hypothetical protein
MRYIKQNDLQSVYALHILNNTLEYGPTDNIMSLFEQVNRGPLMNSFEQFYIITLSTK